MRTRTCTCMCVCVSIRIHSSNEEFSNYFTDLNLLMPYWISEPLFLMSLAHTHTCTHTHTHTPTHTHAHVYRHPHTCACMRVRVRIQIHSSNVESSNYFTDLNLLMPYWTSEPLFLMSLSLSHTHACIYTRTYTYTCMRVRVFKYTAAMKNPSNYFTDLNLLMPYWISEPLFLMSLSLTHPRVHISTNKHTCTYTCTAHLHMHGCVYSNTQQQ